MRGSLQKQHKKSVSRFLATALSFGLFLYFGYHLVHGDRGYFALKGLDQKLAQMQREYDDKTAERTELENRVIRLRPGSLDLDLLDERARIVLGFIAPDERVLLVAN